MSKPLASERFHRVVFDRAKYGMPLLVDACPISSIDEFTLRGRTHHLGFYEVALVTRGAGTLQLDDAAIEIAPRRVAVTCPGEMRRWHLGTSGLDGWLVFFEAGFVNEFFREGRFVERMPLMASEPRRRSLAASSRGFESLAEIACGMRDELQAVRRDSEHALRADTYRLLVALQRMIAPSANEARPDWRARAVCERFEEALESRFVAQHCVGDYAALLGVTAHHLNECVRDAAGITAREAIHRRRHLEACRLLLHTDQSVAAISDALGFSGPSWFTRFFKRIEGTTPREYRAGRK